MKLSQTIIRRFGASLLLLCISFFLSMQTGFAQGGARVGVFKDFQIRPGAIVEVPVDVRDVIGLYAYDIELSFDPEFLDFDDADPNKNGIQAGIGMFLDPGVTLVNQIYYEDGLVHVMLSQINPSEPKSGSGNLLVLYLTGLKTGQTTLEVTRVELSTQNGEAIAVSVENAEIEIVSGAPIVTATNIPVIDPIDITETPTLDPSKLPTTPTPMPTMTPVPTRTATSMATQTRTATLTNAPVSTQSEMFTATPQPMVVVEPTDTAAPASEPTDGTEAVISPPSSTDSDINGGRELDKDTARGFRNILPWLLGAAALLIIGGGVFIRTHNKQSDLRGE